MIFRSMFGRRKGGEEEFLAEVPAEAAPPPELRQMQENAERFRRFHRAKVEKVLGDLNPLDRQVFLALPLLLHIREPDYPGAGLREVPCGIEGYQPPEEAREALRGLFPEARPLPHPLPRARNPAVESLALMGSIGSVAQTRKSDFDFWVCIDRASLGEEAYGRFVQKLKALEEWAYKASRLEVHLFPTDLEEARRNVFGESDTESAGSALGKLLKEEFYRTGTVVAGKLPLWVLFPPDIPEREYERLRGLLRGSLEVAEREFVDLGHVERISADESFGAALWQLNKAMGSPFKSALKIALIEGYMDAGTNSELLCERLKANVLAGATDPGATDAYLMMFERILEYYGAKGRKDLTDILRRCFYLKVGVLVEDPASPLNQRDPRRALMARTVQRWGWDKALLADLNGFRDWPFERSLELARQVNGFLVDAYKRLSERAKAEEGLRQRIRPSDLTVLGRKLFTFYSRKPNKVEFLPRSFEDSLAQDALTLCPIQGADRRVVWKVYREAVGKAEVQARAAEHRLLCRAEHLPERLLWLVQNGIARRDTALHLIPSPFPLTVPDIQDLLGTLTSFLPPVDIPHLSNRALLEESQVVKALVIMNFGQMKLSSQVGKVEVCYQTSWGELFHECTPQVSGPEEALQFVLARAGRAPGGRAPEVLLYVPSGRTGQSNRLMYQEFDQLLRETLEFLLGAPPPEGTLRTYLFQGEGRIRSVSWDGKEARAAAHRNAEEFCLQLDHRSGCRHELRVMASPVNLLALQAIAARFEPGRPQAFFLEEPAGIKMFYRDERGAMAARTLSRNEWQYYAARLHRFLCDALPRSASPPAAAGPPVRYFQVRARGAQQDRFEVTEITLEVERKSESAMATAEPIQARTEGGEGGAGALVFEFTGSQCSAREFGGELFSEVARRVLERRQNKAKYPIFLTGVELPPDYREQHCPRGTQSVHYLLYKDLLERQLNAALKGI